METLKAFLGISQTYTLVRFYLCGVVPFKEALAFLNDALTGFGLRSQIKVLASGKILNSFNIFRAVALGADACYSARAMMMALGCIQALECNKNTCPTGVATQIPELAAGLVVSDKKCV